jgi:hypothetical protein
MSRIVAHREAWFPQTAEEREAVLRELQKIVDSPYFCNSKRYPALLQYIVEKALAGRSDLLKERTLGIDVFDRPPTYDTNADTVVRYTAGEVRKRLQLHYSEHGGPGIRISLPTGSYVPEFLPEDEHHSRGGAVPAPSASEADKDSPQILDRVKAEAEQPVSPAIPAESAPGTRLESNTLKAPASKRGLWVISAGALVALAVTALALGFRASSPNRVVDEFWAPVLHNQHTVTVCIGGVVFQKNDFSGVITASKDADYPFVSMQAASAVAQVSALVDHSGAAAKVIPSPTTPLSELRERPVILLGAYNNQWTMRLLQSARYAFTPEPNEFIVDQKQPQMHWTRDRSRPYASTDDYAVIERFHDATTGDWVVALAGLGRNGTEAAAQFATSPHYLQELKDRMGGSFAAERNIAAVLKVRVIDGKTGAPSIEAAQTW